MDSPKLTVVTVVHQAQLLEAFYKRVSQENNKPFTWLIIDLSADGGQEASAIAQCLLTYTHLNFVHVKAKHRGLNQALLTAVAQTGAEEVLYLETVDQGIMVSSFGDLALQKAAFEQTITKRMRQKQRRTWIASSAVACAVLVGGYGAYQNQKTLELTELEVPMGDLNASVPIETKWEKGPWEIVFADEFNKPGVPDTTKWQVQEYLRDKNPDPKGSNGLWTKDAVKVNNDGQLEISLSTKTRADGVVDYAAGMVRSYDKFEYTYGKYEIRCKLPTQKGWWVAFWLLSDGMSIVDNSGETGNEVDIFEGFGHNNWIYHTVHWDGFGADHKAVSSAASVLKHDEFNTFTLIWTPTEYQFYINNKLSWVTKGGGVAKNPHYLKITGEAATHGWKIQDSWAGKPDPTKLPDKFLVDYIRVYKYTGK